MNVYFYIFHFLNIFSSHSRHISELFYNKVFHSSNFRNIMIRLLITLLVQVVLANSINAQSPFGTLENKWTFEGWSEGSGWEPNWQGDCTENPIIFETTSEVIINGITCGVIKSNKNSDSLIVYQENGEVFFYENSSFYKLYDFNATLGDTIISFRPSIADSYSLKDFFFNQVEEFTTVDTLYTIIKELDTTTINGVQLKRWSTEPFLKDPANRITRRYETIIENIGSLNGILGDHDFFVATGCYGGFVCYESPGFNYGSYFFPLCDFTSSVAEVDEFQINIYPNPASDKILIESKNFEVKLIEVYNSTGQVIMSTVDLEIRLDDWPTGIYILRISDDSNNSVSKKILKL